MNIFRGSCSTVFCQLKLNGWKHVQETKRSIIAIYQTFCNSQIYGILCFSYLLPKNVIRRIVLIPRAFLTPRIAQYDHLRKRFVSSLFLDLHSFVSWLRRPVKFQSPTKGSQGNVSDNHKGCLIEITKRKIFYTKQNIPGTIVSEWLIFQ